MKYKVLVVDDEFLLRMTLEGGLSDLGYQVQTAPDIKAGLAAAEAFHPDAILLDNRMGSDSGLAHIADFKRLDEDVQIILMTAYGSVSQAV
ncbi:MAG: response regulator, partial [Pseudoflavonifractor sp.]|nr:response regulator [Pseudoflavonifractor sp.]